MRTRKVFDIQRIVDLATARTCRLHEIGSGILHLIVCCCCNSIVQWQLEPAETGSQAIGHIRRDRDAVAGKDANGISRTEGQTLGMESTIT